jgi:hypothetical protein
VATDQLASGLVLLSSEYTDAHILAAAGTADIYWQVSLTEFELKVSMF